MIPEVEARIAANLPGFAPATKIVAQIAPKERLT